MKLATDLRLGTRYRCRLGVSRFSCSQGDGTPRRRTCTFCGGELIIERGRWGVFHWNGEGRHPVDTALVTYVLQTHARRYIERNAGQNLVDRWISERDLQAVGA